MAIQTSELLFRKPAEISIAGTNGGRRTYTTIVSGVTNNLIPDADVSELTNGSTRYYKTFLHVANDDDLALISPRFFVMRPTAGDDSILMFPGTATDTQATMGAPAQYYGVGNLNADVSAGASSLVVLVEDWTLAPIFVAGMLVRVSSKALPSSGTGVTEYKTIDTGGVAINGNQITLTFTEPLANSFAAADTKVSSVYEPSDIQASATTPSISGGGSYNHATYPILGDGIGSIEQDWTITATSSTQATVTGNTVGLLGTFSLTSDLSPNNANASQPYFVVNRLGWAGVVVGTEMTFTTHDSSQALWLRRDIPAGSSSLTGNAAWIGVEGQSSAN